MATQMRRSGIMPGAKIDGSGAGFAVDPGPYEAVVISHVQGTRSGQMMVYIPDWGGASTDPNNQILVSYASPFYGKTYLTDTQAIDPNSPSAQFTTGQSYGMWFVPPDVGNKVLVTFAAGDRNRGYWFACIYDSFSHHMVPAVGRNVGGGLSTGKTKKPIPDDSISQNIDANSVLPVVEASTRYNTAFTADGITNTPRYIHEYQTAVLLNQGLDRDPVRGAISSSSLRESPSNCYGISTPGKQLGNGIPSSSSVNADQTVFARQGGHTFVMDDGDANGVDRLVRLRTAGGHQILMNDTEQIVYIASASGNQWMEFSTTGAINIYGAAGFNVRSEGPINMHSDSLIAMNAQAVEINGELAVNISSKAGVSVTGLASASVTTDGMLTLSAMGMATLAAGARLSVGSLGDTSITGAVILLNSGLPAVPTPALPAKENTLPDVTYNGQRWVLTPGAIQSVCTTVPAHEPWLDPSNNQRPIASA